MTRTLAGLVADSTLGEGTNPRAGRRVLAVGAMFTGALLGTLLLRSYGLAWPLLASTVVVSAVAIGYRE
ncbi:hypothetical protein SAMN05421505_13460 [Sinosporangium album]|uniref:DUF1275 domain-containing protein n=2 Tax=Sinosporangium album TaxID=504805 RepID=A0A1G8HYU3_9ACTN|nr:hypothetical protein SAMN05421505_13460 [Sinosporangium album]